MADHEVGQQDRSALKHLIDHGFMGIEELPEWLDVDVVLTVELLEAVFRLHGVEPDKGGVAIELGCHPQREVGHVDERSWLTVKLEVGPAVEGDVALLDLVDDEESLAGDPACPFDAGRCEILPVAGNQNTLHRFLFELWIGLNHDQRVVGRVLEHLATLLACLLGLDLRHRSCLQPVEIVDPIPPVVARDRHWVLELPLPLLPLSGALVIREVLCLDEPLVDRLKG